MQLIRHVKQTKINNPPPPPSLKKEQKKKTRHKHAARRKRQNSNQSLLLFYSSHMPKPRCMYRYNAYDLICMWLSKFKPSFYKYLLPDRIPWMYKNIDGPGVGVGVGWRGGWGDGGGTLFPREYTVPRTVMGFEAGRSFKSGRRILKLVGFYIRPA